jgi:hypothetical protein
MSEGLCVYCKCVYILVGRVLPLHYVGLHPHVTECFGSRKLPTKLVIDNELVDATKAAKEIE